MLLFVGKRGARVSDEEFRSLLHQRFGGDVVALAEALGSTPGQVFTWASKPAGIAYRLPRRIERRAQELLAAGR